ncbi:MAG TPA: hypothetical protein VLK33_05780, partial [Terriglobales bacterium]|nr:hypothetical protein [Terriglobales bacterium]
NAAASVPGTLVYTPAAGTVLTAGTQTLSVAFTPNDYESPAHLCALNLQFVKFPREFHADSGMTPQ